MQERVDEGEHPAVADRRRHLRTQRRVRDGVEIRLQIRIDDVAIAGAQQRRDPTQRIFGAATADESHSCAWQTSRRRSVPRPDAGRFARRGPARSESRAGAAPAGPSGSVASDRLRPVRAVPQQHRQRREIRVESRLIHRDRDVIHTRCATIRLHPREGRP